MIVGADNVTIDLNGYAIRGLGTDAGIGIDVSGRTGVTVKNGRITDFAQGVQLFKRLGLDRGATRHPPDGDRHLGGPHR